MGHPLQPFEVQAGDLLPSLEGAAIGRFSGEPLDLSTATARLVMRASGPAGAVVATGLATILGATQLTASGMNLAYHWAAGQTASPGFYQARFKLVFPGGREQSVPGRGWIPVVIGDDTD
jgi:hypothetical protein